MYLMFYIIIYGSKSKVLLLILIGCFLFNYDKNEIQEFDNDYHVAVVDEVYSSSITVIEEGHKYYLMKVNENLSKGDVVSYQTEYYYDIEKGSFDIFYKSTKSEGYGYANELNIISKKENIRNNIHNDLYEDNSYYSDFALLLLYGEEEGIGVQVKNKINAMGISHLFVVSGFHISLFFIMIEKVGNQFIRNRKLVSLIAFTISVSFLYLVYFPYTGLRALITMMIIRSHKYDKIDSLALTGIIFYIWNPWIMFSSSMILSFSITFAIYFFRPESISFSDGVTLSMFAFYISLPTVSTWENTHNLLAPLLSLVMTPIVSIMYVTSLLLLPFKECWNLFDYVYQAFYWIIIIFSSLEITFYTQIIGFAKQVALTILCVSYIALLKEKKWHILSSFFSISLIIFLI